MITKSFVSRPSDDANQTSLEELQLRIGAMSDATPDEEARPIAQKLTLLFLKEPVAVSMLFCLLAAMVERPFFVEKALESLAAREQAAESEPEALNIHFQGALAAFAAGDVAQAIDIAEHCLTIARKVEAKPGDELGRVDNLILSICSDLAYYHADLVGSHEGEKRKSEKRAKAYLKDCVALYPQAQIPKQGLNAPDTEIARALLTSRDPLRVFFALDNEAYVLIKTAENISDLRNVKQRLDFLHQHVPSDGVLAASLAIDYHEYCWRQRLTDLEGR
jgi:tetratricopeptide (TPR) repeat protein